MILQNNKRIISVNLKINANLKTYISIYYFYTYDVTDCSIKMFHKVIVLLDYIDFSNAI